MKQSVLFCSLLIFSFTFISCGQQSNHSDEIKSISSENVFGVNDRKRVITLTSPLKKVGLILMVDKNNQIAGTCTGALISKSLVLTAAHCVSVGQTKIVFALGLKGKDDFLDNAIATEAWIGTPNVRKAFWKDWAILKINKPLGEKYGWFDIAVPGEGVVDEFPKLKIAGHSPYFNSSLFMTANIGTTCNIKEYPALGKEGPVDNNVFFYDCDMGGGDSGGPLYVCDENDDSKCYIVGLNSSHLMPRTVRAAAAEFPTYTGKYPNVAVSAASFINMANALKQSH